MNIAKKAAAFALSALMVVGAGGCAMGENTKWAAKWENTTVPAGVYLNFMMNEYYNVTEKLTENGEEAPADPLKEQVDGVSVPDAITAAARDTLIRYVGAERKFDEMGLTISPEEQALQDSMVDAYWSYLETLYTQNGISQESYKLVMGDSSKQQALFTAVYGEGGEREVPESELKAKFESDYAKILVIPLDFSKNEDEQAKKEADEKTRAFIDKYYQRAKAGEDMEDLVFEARQEAKPGEELTKPEPGTSYTFVNKESTSYADNVVESIFAAKNGEPTVVESDTTLYLFVRYDINENNDDFSSRRDALLTALKSDEFKDLLLEWGKSYSDTVYNEEAFKRYTADKLKLQ